MWTNDSLSARLRALAAFQVFATRRTFEAEFEPDDSQAKDARLDVVAFSLGAEILARSLGLEISTSEILPLGGDVDEYAVLIANDVAASTVLPELIVEHFGESAAAHFT